MLIVLGALVAGCGSAAESSCGDRIVTDWNDGRIDGIYPLHCYDEAVDRLPEDVRVYSSAADDITRALRQQLRSEGADETPSSVRPADVLHLAESDSSESP